MNLLYAIFQIQPEKEIEKIRSISKMGQIKRFPGYYFLKFWYAFLSIISEPLSISSLI